MEVGDAGDYFPKFHLNVRHLNFFIVQTVKISNIFSFFFSKKYPHLPHLKLSCPCCCCRATILIPAKVLLKSSALSHHTLVSVKMVRQRHLLSKLFSIAKSLSRISRLEVVGLFLEIRVKLSSWILTKLPWIPRIKFSILGYLD